MKEQTPLEQLVEIISGLKKLAIDSRERYAISLLDVLNRKCVQLVLIEKEREQKIASDAWDACEKIF